MLPPRILKKQKIELFYTRPLFYVDIDRPNNDVCYQETRWSGYRKEDGSLVPLVLFDVKTSPHDWRCQCGYNHLPKYCDLRCQGKDCIHLNFNQRICKECGMIEGIQNIFL